MRRYSKAHNRQMHYVSTRYTPHETDSIPLTEYIPFCVRYRDANRSGDEPGGEGCVAPGLKCSPFKSRCVVGLERGNRSPVKCLDNLNQIHLRLGVPL